MSVSSSVSQHSPEPPISELCVNLDNEFMNMQEQSKAEGMHVYARIRPMLDSEIEAGYKECIMAISDQTVRAVVPASSAKFKSVTHLNQDYIEDFTFTTAYGPETGQFVFFQECMMNTMLNFIEGQNSLVFSYGITGSGKTFTLQGNTDNPGIIPLSLHLFFSTIEDRILDRIIVKPDKFADVIVLNDNEIKREQELKRQLLSSCDQEEWNVKASSSKKSFAMILCDTFSEKFTAECPETTLCPEEMVQAQAAALMKELSKKSSDQQSGYCSIWVSFVEIYNENIYDLLQPNINQRPKLALGEDKNGDVYVKGLHEISVSNSLEALKLLKFGQKNLNIASTKLNYKSSRSHCIFTVKVIRIPDPENITYAKVNRLSFCDLAGSERAAKSQTTGMRLKEAGCINTSLLVLGRCIEQLRMQPSQREKRLIPFRESKLTRLFSGFFTGRGKAVMITNASPSELTFDETLHALRFSALAKELIINDCYIATASNTLQCITNMWSNARNNVTNSSDKSISFEDSIDDVIQEKDEIIEKLLDLAESLKNNLEKETREKAELEMKIRDDVCKEYSEYSDQLLENQREHLIEERETIREIYQKRIDSMEKMYEEIIKEYKEQMEESDSENENFEIIQSQSTQKVKPDETTMDNKCVKTIDSSPAAVNLKRVNEETKEELQKTVDYTVSLESELETLRKLLEDTKLELKSAIKDNDEMRRELDASKIDCFAYKMDNDGLFKEKTILEADVRTLTEKLGSLAAEKEFLNQKLIDSENKVSEKDKEIENLLNKIEELMKSQDESLVNHKNSIEKIEQISYELDEKNLKIIQLESAISELNTKLSMKDDELLLCNTENEKTMETLLHDMGNMKLENIELQEKLKAADDCVLNLNETINELKADMEAKSNNHMDSINQKLDDAQTTINLLKEELEKEIAESDVSKDEISNLKLLNKELQNKKAEHESECITLKNELVSTNKKLDDAQLTINHLKEDIEKMTAESCKNKNEIEDKVSEIESKDDMDSIKQKFDHAQLSINLLKEELEKLTAERNIDKNEKEKFMLLNDELQNKKSEYESECVTLKDELVCINKKLEDAQLTIKQFEEDIKKLMAESSEDKNEIEKLNKEVEHMKSESESECIKLKDDLACINKKLEDAQLTINQLKQELEKMTAESSEDKNEIEKLNKELQDKKSEIECKNMNTIDQNQDDAQSSINLLKEELEKVTAESNASKTEIEKLMLMNSELQNKNSEHESKFITLQDLLARMSTELLDAQLTINELKKDIEKRTAENGVNKNEIEKLNKEIQDKRSESKIILELTHILENCELKASNKIKEMHSDYEQLATKLENLKNQIKSADEVHKKECDTLYELIQVLQKCEAYSTNKLKQLHTSSIEHVEQIMDLEQLLKSKEAKIESLKNDHNNLQKQLKESQATFKKQLQNEKQLFTTEIGDLKNEQLSIKKKNSSLKEQITQLEKEKQQLATEINKENVSLKEQISKLKSEKEGLETQLEKLKDNKNELEDKRGKLSLEARNLKIQLERINVAHVNKDEKVVKDKVSEKKTKRHKNSGKALSESEVKTPKLDVNIVEEEVSEKRTSRDVNIVEEEVSEKRTSKARDANSVEEKALDRKTTKTRSQGDKKNKNSSNKLEKNLPEKPKTKIYKETDENSSSGNIKQETRPLRKHLRCMDNVSENVPLVENKSEQNKQLKRKALKESSNKIADEQRMKKIKLHDIKDIENMEKPQNLRIKLLKGDVIKNDTVAPSPRMTRGRKRLFLEKKNVKNNLLSPRTVRS